MGMLLRRNRELNKAVTTYDSLNEKPEAKETKVKATESVKDEPPKTVKRGRPTKKQ